MIRMITVALLAGLSASPAVAQSLSPSPALAEQQKADIFEQLFETIVASVDGPNLDRRIRAEMHRALMADADVAALEKDQPGTITQMIRATMPIFQRHAQRITAMKRGALVPIFRKWLTPDEAKEADGFYTSPLGQRLLGTVVQNMSVQNQVKVQDSAPQSELATAIRADTAQTTASVLEALTPSERTELDQALNNRGWVLQLRLALDEIAAVRAAIESEPLTAEDEAAVVAAVESVIRKRRKTEK